MISGTPLVCHRHLHRLLRQRVVDDLFANPTASTAEYGHAGCTDAPGLVNNLSGNLRVHDGIQVLREDLQPGALHLLGFWMGWDLDIPTYLDSNDLKCLSPLLG